MRILFVSQERRYTRVVQELRKRNRVDYIFMSDKFKRDNGDYHIPKLFGKHIGFRILEFILVHFLIFLKRYDFCITDYRCVSRPFFFMVCNSLKTLKGTKFIHDLRTIPVEHDEKYSKSIVDKFFRQLAFADKHYDAITMITEEMKKHIERKYFRFARPIGIWESGANTEYFKQLPKNMNLKRKLGFKDEDFVCFYHGTITERRGVIELVQSFTLIKTGEGKIKLFLLGRGKSINKVEQIIRDFKLDDNVRLHGWVEYTEVPEFISIADLCIVPLPDIDWWQVSSPLKLMDYIACGKNILMTDIVAHRNVVGKKNEYFFIDQVSAESLAEGIEQAYNVFRNNETEYQQRGITEREKHISNISWESRSRDLEEFLCRINEAP